MKQHKKTDQIIKEKVEQYSAETPMHLFDGIMDALDIEAAPAPKENPSRRNWLLSLLAIVLIGGGTWYSFSGKVPTDASIEKLTINVDEKNQNTTTDNVIAKESITSTENTNNENSNTKTQFSNTITAATDVQNTSVNTAKTSIATSKSNHLSTSIEKNNNTFTNNSFSITIQNLENKTAIQNASTSSFNLKKDQLMEKGESFNNTTSTPQNPIINSTNNISTEKNTTSSSSALENKKASIKNNKVIASRSSVKESVLFLPDLKSTQRLSRNSKPYKIDVEPRCGLKPDGSKIRFTTSVDAFFSPDFAVQMLEYKSENFKDHAEMRTNSESPYYSFNTGLRVNFLTEFGWAFRTGVVYTQINDVLKTTHREVVIQLNTVGDTISIAEGTREVNIRNRYKMVDIPVLIGYEVPMKRFTLNVNGGVYVNIQSKQSGAFFSPLEDKVVYFTEGHPDNYDIFKNNIGLSAFLGLGFNFNLGKKTQLIVEPHTRFYPKSFTMKSYILNQKYLSTGVMIGLRRDL